MKIRWPKTGIRIDLKVRIERPGEDTVGVDVHLDAAEGIPATLEVRSVK